MKLPVRVELHSNPSDLVCSFTIFFEFGKEPSNGDKIFISNDICLSIAYHLHYDDASFLIMTRPFVAGEYDDALRVLDWFKAHYTLQDAKATAKPAPYYRFYRGVAILMGLDKVERPVLKYDQEYCKIFAESCRSVLVAETLENQNAIHIDRVHELRVGFNPLIESLHNIILGRKRSDPDGVEILDLVRQWFSNCILPELAWESLPENCKIVAQIVFQKLRSTPQVNKFIAENLD